MLLDQIILYLSLAIAIGGVFLLTPRGQSREAHIVFLFKQAITWILGLLIVEFRQVEYPVRIFQNATEASFAFEYIIFPATCVVFVLRFPERKSLFHKIGWYVFFPTWMTIIEIFMERYTNLVHYIHWTWYCTWISLFATLYIARVYYLWFMKKGTANIRTESSED